MAEQTLFDIAPNVNRSKQSRHERAMERSRRYRAKKHAERFGPNAGNMSGRHGNHAKGEKNGRWNDGKLISSHGYVLVRVPKNHHRAFGNGYAYEHDIVIEKKLGRVLVAGEVVHHKDENKQNNSPENLELLSASEHMSLHDAQRERDDDGRFLASIRQFPHSRAPCK